MSVVWRALLMLVVAAGMVGLGCRGDESPTSTVTTTATSEPTSEATGSATPGGDGVVLWWRREGGIAGFCDGLAVTEGHRGSVGTCTDPSAVAANVLIPVEWIGALEVWRDRVASFERTWEDPPGQTDRMTIAIRFEGRGTSQASEEEQREIAEFATELFNALDSLQPRVGLLTHAAR